MAEWSLHKCANAVLDIRAVFFFYTQATSNRDLFDINVAFRQIQASNSIIPLLRTQDVVQLQLPLTVSSAKVLLSFNGGKKQPQSSSNSWSQSPNPFCPRFQLVNVMPFGYRSTLTDSPNKAFQNVVRQKRYGCLDWFHSEVMSASAHLQLNFHVAPDRRRHSPVGVFCMRALHFTLKRTQVSCKTQTIRCAARLGQKQRHTASQQGM